ncbi:class I SAM-dependent methyltransferase [Nocardioides sp. DS6]|uniref:S-adenosyl-L-methionine-dependent methyltransferase n=1 Tax=Nocardioides eburneus TaxID=3231482 RepID=A0ABV3T4C3_9ACTN
MPGSDPQASRSAVLVAQARAVADGRIAVGRFSDPVAVRLLDGDERAGVARARSSERPTTFADRVPDEMLRATAEHMAVRTIAVDEAVRAAGHRQLVLLGAGLDARAWRMSGLHDTAVLEVDQPASQADKRRRVTAAGDLPLVAARHAFVPVDLARTPLAPALAAAGFDATVPTTWVWEGVVMYLTPAQVEATLGQVTALSAPGSLLAVHYTTRSLLTRAGRALFQVAARRAGADPLAHEPNRSAWSPGRMGRLLAAHGFVTSEDRSLLDLAADLGLVPERTGSLRAGRLVLATRTG